MKRLLNARWRAKRKEKAKNTKIANKPKPVSKVLYKAPPKLDLTEMTFASLLEKPSNDLRRLVLKLGISALRSELDRIEKEI